MRRWRERRRGDGGEERVGEWRERRVGEEEMVEGRGERGRRGEEMTGGEPVSQPLPFLLPRLCWQPRTSFSSPSGNVNCLSFSSSSPSGNVKCLLMFL